MDGIDQPTPTMPPQHPGEPISNSSSSAGAQTDPKARSKSGGMLVSPRPPASSAPGTANYPGVLASVAANSARNASLPVNSMMELLAATAEAAQEEEARQKMKEKKSKSHQVERRKQKKPVSLPKNSSTTGARAGVSLTGASAGASAAASAAVTSAGRPAKRSASESAMEDGKGKTLNDGKGRKSASASSPVVSRPKKTIRLTPNPNVAVRQAVEDVISARAGGMHQYPGLSSSRSGAVAATELDDQNELMSLSLAQQHWMLVNQAQGRPSPGQIARSPGA